MEKTRQLIDAAWKAWWEALPSGGPFPLEYHNQAHRTPATGLYGRMSVVSSDASPASVGPVHERIECALVLQVFLPEGDNYATVTTVHDTVRTFWRYKQIRDTTGSVVTHLDFGNTTLQPAGARDGYKQYNVWTNFRCDKFFST